MSIVSVKQSLMNGVAVVYRISCTAIEPRHGQGGTARHSPESNGRQVLPRAHDTDLVDTHLVHMVSNSVVRKAALHGRSNSSY
jgi:hypothetical protein